jgi:tetratricopeptide (TPR) repeat protein
MDEIIKMDLDEIIKNIEEYYKHGKFQEAIELIENAIKIHKDDYRLYSSLCRCYNNLEPKLVPHYDHLQIDEIKSFTNYAIKAITYGEQGLVLLLKDKNKIDGDLTLTSFILADLGEAILSYNLLIYRLRKLCKDENYFINLNESLFNELSKFFRQGFDEYDESFEIYRDASNNYKSIKEII